MSMDILRDIHTPRLVLRLMDDAVTAACLTGDLSRAGRLLRVAIPAELLDEQTGLEDGPEELALDPQYRPWSMRAIILSQTQTMVGLTRFHTRPDPEYLHQYGPDAVEFGYHIFASYRRRGYATEAVRAVMKWAQAAFGIRRFVTSVSPDNLASLNLIARFGFARVGTQRDEVDRIEHVFLRTAAGV